MARDSRLRDFVGAALAAGRSRAEIAEALSRAGWSAGEARAALAAWADTPFVPPVPRPGARLDPRDATVNALVFLAMLLAAVHLVLLGHALVELWVADPVDWTGGLPGRVRWTSAMILVAGPLALLLDRHERRRVAALPGARPPAARAWIAHVTAFVAGAVLLVDLVALIYGFLSGDLTLRFLLKTLVVAAVAGLFLARQRDRWRRLADAVLVLAGIGAIAAGLAEVGGPRQAREMREDRARLTALGTVTATLGCPDPVAPPEALTPAALDGFCGGRSLSDDDLVDPVTGEPLRYEVRGPREFAVCTGFHGAGRLEEARRPGRLPDFEPDTGCLIGRTGG